MEDVGTGTAANLCSEAVKGIFKEAKRHVRYVRIYKRNVEKFEEKLETLLAKRASVQQEVVAAKRNLEKIKADVELWCHRVDKRTEEEKKKVKELEDKARNKCFIGLCPNINCRYQLSRKAEGGAQAFDELIQGGQFNRVSSRDVPEDIMDGPPKDFEAFESRQKVFNDIMEALKDSTISMIGVYGMAGVGKTTLVSEVARQAKKEKLFDEVVSCEVKQTPDIQGIQNQIADPLGLKFEEQSVIGRAGRLCKRLKNEQKILVVLDDLWAGLDLKKVGIPVGDEHKGCIVLLTSRDLNVLNEMEAQKTFEIDVLKEKEAWELLKKVAGDPDESSELPSTATEVAKICAGLPLAIATVGRALRKKRSFAWKDALRKLQRPSETNFKGIPGHVYSAIAFSYDHLGSQELRQTFLLCSLLGDAVNIGDLLKYTLGLGLFLGVNTVEETRDRLLTVVDDLKAYCLLRDCYYSKSHFHMHDLISDVAIAIASKDNVFALKKDAVLQDWPDGDRMKMLNKINLDNASISKLPEGLDCPQLTFFHMHSKDPNVEMPSNFFMEMKNLRVLDLTMMHFPSLPLSISVLTNLRTLCLDQCVLEDIALIGELENLEILSLWKSDIKMLPKEIGQLIKLRLFDLGCCSKLKKIPPGVLSSLSRLEELYMCDSFVEWDVERHANQQTGATLIELKSLSRLTTLEIHIPDAKIMPGDLFFEKLKRYKIFIGKARGWKENYELSRTLKLGLDRSIDHLGDGIKMLMKKTEDLYLDDMKGAKVALRGLIDEEDFQHLKNLHIQNCLDIHYIIDDNGALGNNEFLQLQSLTLQGLPQLISFLCESQRSSASGSQHELPLLGEKMVFPSLKNLRLSSINVERIWPHPFSNRSFRAHENLTSLIIEGCGNLKYLLSSSMARSLVNLKHFEILECRCLREIIFLEEDEIEEEEEVVLFPQLNSLQLKNLPHLLGFCSEDYKIDFPSLDLLVMRHCPTLKGFMYKSKMEDNQLLSPQALFDEKVKFPSLEKLRIAGLRNMKMIWHNQLSVNSFCKLTEMIVGHCNELVSLFPCDMWSTFQRLETLRVCSCGSLEEIFELQSLKMEETHVVTTQFRELHIHDLPKLKHVWSKDPRGTLSFRNLSVVQVWDCWSLKNVFPSSIARVLPQLKDLHIERCGVEEIVAKKEGSDTRISFEFDQLSSLMLWKLPELKCFYPGMHTTRWPILKRLKAWHCNKVKIFDTDMNDYTDYGQHDSPIHRPLFLLEKVITKLEEVCLKSDDIATISDNDKFSSGRFSEVTTLHVHCYHDKFAVFPITFLERFNNLEKLEVGCCEFKELFSYGGGLGKQINARRVLPVKSLRLNGLTNVKYIWKQESGLHHFLPNLETLEVVVCHNLISLGSSSAAFQNLMTLDVRECKAMINLVSSSSAVQSLVQLKILKIRNCKSMKEVVGNEGSEATDDIIFNRLECMELRNLPSLESFCSADHTFVFPSLEQVIVMQCPVLEIFCKGVLNAPMLKGVQAAEEDRKGEWVGDLNSTVKQLYTKKVGYQRLEYLILSDFSKSIDIWKLNLQETLDFANLKVLEVKDCSSMTYIFTVSMVWSLVQLNEIKVSNCPMMEQIIRNEGTQEATVSRIMLHMLKSITLESCSRLTSFFLGSNQLECPSLRKMTLVDCPKMFEFTSVFPRKLETIAGVNAPFFNEKVLCSNLENLELSSLNIKKIWADQRQGTSCNVQNLKTFVVKGCHGLKYILPSSLPEKFAQLNQLEISDCTNVEEVICTQRLMTGTQTELIEAESTTKFVFPEIRSLVLNKLPKLRCFYSKIHTTEWPLLKELRVIGCNKVEIFARDFLQKRGESQAENFQQPFFWVNEDSFPNLEGLRLEANGITEEIIWHGQIPAKYFPKLKWLKLIGFPKNAITLTNCFIQSLPNLEKLQVRLGVGAEEEHLGALARLKELRLSQLPDLRHLWKEESPVGETFSNLRILEVLGCAKLENVIVPSLVSFKNLTTLEVSKCHGLKHLVTLQTARSMMLLERMSIIDCQMMEEIIASTSDEVMGGILFSKLKSLELGSLPSLSRFCSGNHTFGFPSLEQVIMGQCPKMEIFSEGELSTPMLEGIQSTEGEYVGCWEGDLNAIIRQLFVEKVSPSMEDLEQSSINIQIIWHWKLLVASSYARNLTCLTIEGCPNLKCLFSSSMVRSFVQLKMLDIDNCENVETVISMEGSREAELMSQTSFRILDSLLLRDLPKLTRFCHGSYIEFPLLRFIWIQSCPTLTTFISNSTMGNGAQIDQEAEGNNLEIASPPLFSEKVGFLCLKMVSITGAGKWRKIWHDDQPTNSARIHFAN